MSRYAKERGKAAPPWRLLALSGIIGYAFSVLSAGPGLHPTVSGRAQLNTALKPTQTGWQLQVDPRALGLGAKQAQSILASFSSQPFPDLAWSAPLLNLTDINGKVEVSLAEPSSRPIKSDPIFGGTPALAFEWSRRPLNVRGNLFAQSGTSPLLCGRLVGVLPFNGLIVTGDGFPLSALGPLPRRVDSLVAVDAAMLSFLPTFRGPIQSEWDRWEFNPVQDLGQAIGPALVYAKWRGAALFSIGVKDMAVVEKAIEQRFPEAIIRTSVAWSNGSRVRGFNPDGPAWLLRGDHLLATRTGGVKRLQAALQQALASADQRDLSVAPSALMKRVTELAAHEKGWHVVIVKTEPGSPIHWAALVRWPTLGSTRITGFLVVEPQNATPTRANEISSPRQRPLLEATPSPGAEIAPIGN